MPASIAPASRMKRATSDKGRLMSWLAMAPMWRLASGMVSRIAHRSAACWPDRAITPSRTRPASAASVNSPSSAASADRPAGSPTSISTSQSGRSVKGWRRAGKAASRNRSPWPEISSKAVTPPAMRACASDSRVSAASGDSTTSIATPVSAGTGASTRDAAVMTPSVPSAPISRSRMS